MYCINAPYHSNADDEADQLLTITLCDIFGETSCNT